MHQKPGY